MFVEAIFVSIVIGLIRGGKLRRLRFLNYRNIWLLISGIIIQGILILLSRMDDISVIDSIMLFAKEVQIISYALILFGITINIRYKSLWLILAGYFMNFIAVWGNDWKIPILSQAIELTNGSALNGNLLYSPISQGTKLAMLGDVIVFADPYPMPKIISIGDLIVGFGIFVLIQEIMLGKDSFMRRGRG